MAVRQLIEQQKKRAQYTPQQLREIRSRIASHHLARDFKHAAAHVQHDPIVGDRRRRTTARHRCLARTETCAAAVRSRRCATRGGPAAGRLLERKAPTAIPHTAVRCAPRRLLPAVLLKLAQLLQLEQRKLLLLVLPLCEGKRERANAQKWRQACFSALKWRETRGTPIECIASLRPRA